MSTLPGLERYALGAEFPCPYVPNFVTVDEADEFFTDSFIMSDSGHAEAWQKTGLDIYFAIVKHPNDLTGLVGGGATIKL